MEIISLFAVFLYLKFSINGIWGTEMRKSMCVCVFQSGK